MYNTFFFKSDFSTIRNRKYCLREGGGPYIFQFFFNPLQFGLPDLYQKKVANIECIVVYLFQILINVFVLYSIYQL